MLHRKFPLLFPLTSRSQARLPQVWHSLPHPAHAHLELVGLSARCCCPSRWEQGGPDRPDKWKVQIRQSDVVDIPRRRDIRHPPPADGNRFQGDARLYNPLASRGLTAPKTAFSSQAVVFEGYPSFVAENAGQSPEKTCTFAPLPGFVIKVLSGEMGVKLTIQLESQKVLPNRLLEEGYEFLHPDLETALQDTLGLW